MEASFANGDSHLKPDLLSYNTVLDAFSKEGDAKSADRLLEQMLGKGDDTIRPDAYSYTAVCSSIQYCSSSVIFVSQTTFLIIVLGSHGMVKKR